MRTGLVTALSAITVFILGWLGLFYSPTVQAPDTQVAFTASQVATDAPDTFGGPDGSVKLSDDVRVNAGVCRTFTGRIYITVCVPLYSPFGGILDGKVYEDGSASYSDGWVIDSETREFYKGDCWAENVGTEDAPNIIAASANTPDGLCQS